MNPGDVAQSVLPLTSSDLSLFTLFLHAHWLVKMRDGRAAGLPRSGSGRS